MLNQNRKGFTLAHLNIRSLKHKLEGVTAHLHLESINVLSLSETWLTPSIESAILSIEGFNFFRHDRKSTASSRPSKGGGLALYVDNTCLVDDSKFSRYNISNSNIEAQVILV